MLKIIAVDGIKKEIGHISSQFRGDVFVKVFRRLDSDFSDFLTFTLKRGRISDGRWFASDRFSFFDIAGLFEIIDRILDSVESFQDTFWDLDFSLNVMRVYTEKYLIDKTWEDYHKAIFKEACSDDPGLCLI